MYCSNTYPEATVVGISSSAIMSIILSHGGHLQQYLVITNSDGMRKLLNAVVGHDSAL